MSERVRVRGRVQVPPRALTRPHSPSCPHRQFVGNRRVPSSSGTAFLRLRPAPQAPSLPGSGTGKLKPALTARTRDSRPGTAAACPGIGSCPAPRPREPRGGAGLGRAHLRRAGPVPGAPGQGRAREMPRGGAGPCGADPVAALAPGRPCRGGERLVTCDLPLPTAPSGLQPPALGPGEQGCG